MTFDEYKKQVFKERPEVKKEYKRLGKRKVKNKSGQKHKVRLSCTVTPMTLWNLKRLAKMCKYGDNIGKVIDKLVREKCMSMKEWGEK